MAYRDLVNKFSTTGVGRFLLRHVASRVDPTLYRWSKGKFTIAGPPTVPQCILVAKGAKSGEPRKVQLAYTPVGDSYLVVASNMGSDRAPAWMHNLVAHPDAVIEVDGLIMPVTATRLSAADAAPLWPKLDATVPQYRVYRMLTNREIPVFRLTPKA